MTKNAGVWCKQSEDKGTEEERKRYIELLEILSNVYHLHGLPKDRSVLFNNYVLPPQIPWKDRLSKSEISWPTSRVPAGCANVLFNSDFVLILGRVEGKSTDYGYMAMLLRTDTGHIYTTTEQTVEKKAYRYSHGRLLGDLRELVIAAFHDKKECLTKYQKGNPEIGMYLSRGYVQKSDRFKTTRHWVHVCSECHKPYYETSPTCHARDLCGVCLQKAIDRAEVTMMSLSEYPGADYSDGVYVYDSDGEVLGPA